MRRRAGHIVDDRGFEVPLLRPVDLPKGSDQTLKKAVAHGQAGTWRTLVYGAAAMAIGMSISGLFRYAKHGGPLLAGTLLANTVFGGLGGLLGGWFTSMSMGRRYRGEARAACLTAGLCPSCGYSLKGVTPSAAFRRVCPECGCAWRV